MTIGPETGLVDVAFEVCTALMKNGSTAVLTGGSAAQFHAPEVCSSFDIDFVLELTSGGVISAEPLSELGYSERSGAYVHPQNPFSVEFPRGPLMVGSEVLTSWSTCPRAEQVLHVLTPTDCCRDRLAAFYFWNDRQSLEQALAIARTKQAEIDLELIRRWSKREGAAERFSEFERRWT